MKKPPPSQQIFCFRCRKIAPRMLVISLFLVLTSASAWGQAPADANLRISQVYPRGGEPGAIYQSDFVELFNRGNTTVDLNGLSFNIDAFDGSSCSRVGICFMSNTSIPIPPGAHLLLQFPGSGTNGQPLNGDIPVPFAGLGSSGGHIVLVAKDQFAPVGCPALPDPTGAVVDYVGYGNATCAEGSVAPAPPSTKALFIIGGATT